MKAATRSRSITLASISRWKCGLGAVFVLALGITPNLPGFGDGLTRSAFFYTAPVGVTVRLLACGVLLSVGLVLLAGVVLSFITSPKAVWIDGSELKWGRIGTKCVPLSDVEAVSFDAGLNRVRLERRGGRKPEYIPTLGLRSQDAPGTLVYKLRELIREV
ncbi:hypothetical protein [Sphingomonas solaris]|uniref:PH domain-containing protein n=1 Tax=Alterirhizorhabdus solaris TaxID=2529389 RepID=A0A558RAG2_9SPHN|nr:hypothetical protein [Sphingomonas solaris]TVV76348.1 hypothetical protein FOY91_04765 [Sphingomonas solaris]